ncbi:MAG TPA: phosphatase PAP2 family protein [Mucilaginibacter sp.]
MGDVSNGSHRITALSIVLALLFSLAYLLLSYWLIGFDGDQVVLVGMILVLYFASSITRKFFLGFAVFGVYWVIFDYMKAFPNYKYNPVHIADLYNFEKHFFGINFNSKILTPNEYLRTTGSTFLDVLCGIFYLCWIPVPMGFGVYLFFTRREQYLHFGLTFLLINLIGFVIYYLFPAAPPWYVELYGFKFYPHTHEGIAGLSKFDDYFHTGVFKSIYSKGSNVFAAMPSLHSAYPVVVFYYSIKNRLGFVSVILAAVMIGIWFTAVYTSHHYLVDVLAGITCAITGISIFNVLNKRVRFFRDFVDGYAKIIE